MLTPSELESLLGQLTAEMDRPPPPIGHSESMPFRRNASPSASELNREQLFALEAMHRQLAGELKAKLSPLLNQAVTWELTKMEYSPIGVSRTVQSRPACWVGLRFDQLAEPVRIEFDAGVLWPILNRMLGGNGEVSETDHERPLTEIELRLVARAGDAFVSAFQAVWQNVTPLHGHVIQVGASDAYADELRVDRSELRTRFVLKPWPDRGGISLVTGLRDVRLLLDRLAIVGEAGDRNSAVSDCHPTSVAARNDEAVECVLLLCETQMNASELQELAVGDIILTSRPIAAGMNLRIGDNLERKATLGQTRGWKAARIMPTEPVDKVVESSEGITVS